MANTASPITTYSDTTPQKRVITDVISLIDPSDAPLIDALGGLDGAASKFRFANDPGTTMEWLEDTLIGLTGTLNGSIASNTTALTLTDSLNVQPGHIVRIDSEDMWVSAVVQSTKVATVTRNFGGTQASHADSAAFQVIGMARLEGASSDAIGFTSLGVGSNYTQIFHQEVKVSRSQQQRSQYGIADELAYQADKIIPQKMREIEQHIIQFQGAAKAGSATTPRTMGGIKAFATTNKVSGATLAQSQFESLTKLIYAAGGDATLLAVLSPTNMAKVKNFYDSSAFLNIQRSETTVGMKITQIETPYATVNLLMDRWAQDTVIPILSMSHVGLSTYYPFTQEPLAKDGDYERAEVVGEFTLCMRQNAAHGLLTAVS